MKAEAALTRDRHADLQARLAGFTGVSAATINVVVVLSAWGHWRLMAIVGALNVAMIAANAVVTLKLVPRVGPRAELLRCAMNIAGSVFAGHLLDWPLATWLWLPFVALVCDHFAPRMAVATTAAMCAAADIVAIVEGVNWVYPAVFTVLAAFCLEISRRRFGFIRDMLKQSDDDRVALEQAHATLQMESGAREKMELELRHAQKLQAVGRLAAGVAHEINTPVQFVNDSVEFMSGATQDLIVLIAEQRRLLEAAAAGASADETRAGAKAAIKAADLAFLEENAPAACASATEGLLRVSRIVRSMQTFASRDRDQSSGVDLNEALRSTVVIAAHEYKLVADVEMKLGELPLVACRSGEINQVLLNILVNAAHAIGSVVAGTQVRGRITVESGVEDGCAVLSISDTGGGIPAEVQPHIFEPFFTTKEVGVGTGQGLAISRSVVMKHGGTLTFDTVAGEGTTFRIALPIAHDAAKAA